MFNDCMKILSTYNYTINLNLAVSFIHVINHWFDLINSQAERSCFPSIQTQEPYNSIHRECSMNKLRLIRKK